MSSPRNIFLLLTLLVAPLITLSVSFPPNRQGGKGCLYVKELKYRRNFFKILFFFAECQKYCPGIVLTCRIVNCQADEHCVIHPYNCTHCGYVSCERNSMA